MARIIDCKSIAAGIKASAHADAQSLPVVPTLAVIQVGDDPASHIYIRNKRRACEECGIRFMYFQFPEQTSASTLRQQIEVLNANQTVHAIMVQCPLPEHLADCPRHIAAEKDVDGITRYAQGALVCDDPTVIPCTVRGILDILDTVLTKDELSGRHAVVIGRSTIVGKPAAMALLNRDCTVTVCHSKTQNLAEVSRQADILVSAVGKPGFITADMVKPGAVVIDVGVNRLPDGKVCGDVSFDEVEPVAGAITTVPGGVGVLTVANLIRNVVDLAMAQVACEYF